MPVIVRALEMRRYNFPTNMSMKKGKTKQAEYEEQAKRRHKKTPHTYTRKKRRRSGEKQ